MKHQTRRNFLKATVRGSAGLVILPNLLSGSLFGAATPNKRIQVAQIGCGRMGRGDMEGVMSHPLARVVGVCDLDSKRLAAAKKLAEDFYTKKGESNVDVKAFADYRE